eukprot:743577-Hanusia_phi.AAC.1
MLLDLEVDAQTGPLSYDYLLLVDAQKSQPLPVDVFDGYADVADGKTKSNQPIEPVGLDFSKFLSFDESDSETQPGDLSASDPAVFSAAASLKAKDPAVCPRRRKSKAPAYRRHPWTREEEERFQ